MGVYLAFLPFASLALVAAVARDKKRAPEMPVTASETDTPALEGKS